MRFKLSVFVVATALSLAGCVSPHQAVTRPTTPAPAPHTFKPMSFTYSENRSAASNFQARLDASAWSCDLEASSGHSLYKMGIRSAIQTYGESLNDCRAHARSEGDQAIQKLNQSKLNGKLMDLSKDLYSKWSTYLGSMSVYSPADASAKNQYEQARSALLTEEKFSK